jgi:PhoPQ-activated pathogenicity-related protein
LDTIGKNTEEKQFEFQNKIKGRLTKFHFSQHKNKMNTFWARAKNRRQQMAYTGVRVDSTIEEEEGNTISVDEEKLSSNERKGLEE